MDLTASNKLHWKLDEKKGLWYALEGDYAEDMVPAPEEWIPRGFSVPTDVIMTKEQQYSKIGCVSEVCSIYNYTA